MDEIEARALRVALAERSHLPDTHIVTREIGQGKWEVIINGAIHITYPWQYILFRLEEIIGRIEQHA